jgi:hypothetical protein
MLVDIAPRLLFAAVRKYTRASFAQFVRGLVEIPAGAGRSAVSCSLNEGVVAAQFWAGD